VWKPHDGLPEPVTASVAETWAPGREGPPTVPAGDALCFELVRAQSGSTRYRVGRTENDELVLSTEALPREFCAVAHAGGGWLVSASPGMSAMSISGDPLAPGIEVPLIEGAVLDLDGLSLSFMGAKSFTTWVAAQR
jgi:hypothetical protein